MKSAVENLDPTRVKLTVEVTFDELKPSFEHAYKHIGEEITVPGFRKGKIPAAIIEQRVGRGAVLEHAINEALPGFYQDAMKEAELRPLGQPEIDVTEVPDPSATDGVLIFTADVDIRPAIELPDLAELNITVDSPEVSDDDVAERLDSLRERFGSLITVERPAADGDFVSIDLNAKIGDEEIDNVTGVSYQIGSGNMLEGLDDALLGLSAGETTSFEAPLAGGERAGEGSVITVTVQSVKERELPEANDDFAQLASEFDTLDELREDLREQVAQTKAANQATQARDLLLAQLTEAIEIPVPVRVIDAEVARHLESEGKELDDPHGDEVRVDAEKSLRTQLLLDELVDTLSVSVNQNELIEYLVSAAGQYGMDPNQFIQAVDGQGQIPQMVGEVARSKAIAQALRQVTVVDQAGVVVDLKKFIGSDEEDALAEVVAAAAAAAEDGDDPASINV